MEKIKKGDTVYVRVGKDAGKTGKVLQVFLAERSASSGSVIRQDGSRTSNRAASQPYQT